MEIIKLITSKLKQIYKQFICDHDFQPIESQKLICEKCDKIIND